MTDSLRFVIMLCYLSIEIYLKVYTTSQAIVIYTFTPGVYYP